MTLRLFSILSRLLCMGLLFSVPLICVSTARGQGAAPETAPTLFPGGGLVSYNSIFTTRAPMAAPLGNIPATARPTFSHEADISFTWGFRRNLDLTVLIPIITNHFESSSAPTVRRDGAWRCDGTCKISILPSGLTSRHDAGIRHVRT